MDPNDPVEARRALLMELYSERMWKFGNLSGWTAVAQWTLDREAVLKVEAKVAFVAVVRGMIE